MLTALPVGPGALAAAPPSDGAQQEAQADDQDETIESLAAELDAETGGTLTMVVDPDTEMVSMLGSTTGAALTEPTIDEPIDIATEFVDQYGEMFGEMSGDDTQFDLTRVAEGLDGTSAVRFQQRVDGLPVLAGEIAVQVDVDGQVLSASGESVASVDLDTTPAIAADVAERTAVALTAKYDAVDPSLLSASTPELTIYDPQLIGAAEVSSTHLVWQVEVATEFHDVERLILIDANDGSITLDVSTREDIGRDRFVCNNNNVGSPDVTCTSPVRTEGGPATGNADADAAYDLSGVTDSFYRTVLGRNGIDDNDLPIVSTVNFCPDSSPCPYNNAFWTGTQTVFGQGYATADDIVAHELTHGVTDYTSRLFYYAESGAINESMSDVFGELIDQWHVDPNDTSGSRWLIGEDLTIATPSRPFLRNMANPAVRSHPDRMQSSLYYEMKFDAYGVHRNSGVGNKAAFLITDGGTFNGQTVVGLGLVKTAQIHYQAQTTLLGPGSDYLDLYHALQQACVSLIGGSGGITTFDCQQVTAAVTATEMNLPPTKPGARLTAPVCAAGTILGETLFSDDMESGTSQWVTAASHPNALWKWYSGSSQSGTRSLHGPDVEVGSSTTDRSMTSSLRLANSLSVPVGTSYLRFDHSFNLEGNANNTQFFDGGIIEYSTNGTAGPWLDAGSGTTLGIVNGYTGTLGSSNTLGSRPAFSGTSPGYQTTRIDLSSLAGQSNVMFRFRIGTDNFVGADGWFIDDVSVYRCATSFAATGPARLLDTRPGESLNALRAVAKTKVGGATVLEVNVANLPGLTPAGGIAAVSLNVTATGAEVAGFVTVYPCGTRPQVSNVNFAAGDTVPNVTIAPVSSSGSICLFANTPVDLVVDLNGWFSVSPGYTAIGPARVLDTRPGQSAGALRTVAKTRVGGANILQVQVADLSDLTPASGVAAVSLNVTSTGSDVPGFVTVYPCGARPTVSNLNFGVGETVANATITPVSTTGAICIFANTPVDVIVDINGWFSADPGFTPAGPGRVLDTRPGESPQQLRNVAKTPVGGAKVLQVQVNNLVGYTPASGIGAVSLNVTAAGSTVAGFVTVYPCGTIGQVSNLNFAAGDTVANAVIAPVSPAGTICIFASTPVNVIVDINGWFVA